MRSKQRWLGGAICFWGGMMAAAIPSIHWWAVALALVAYLLGDHLIETAP